MLPRGWQGVHLAVGWDHVLVQACPDGKGKKPIRDGDPKMRVYAAGSNIHGQLGHGGNPSSKLKLVSALKDHDIHGLFSTENKCCALTSKGKLKCFGEFAWCDSKPKDAADGIDFDDIAIAQSFVVGLHNPNGQDYVLEKLDNTTGARTPIRFDFDVVKIYQMKTGGNHVCLKVAINEKSLQGSE